MTDANRQSHWETVYITRRENEVSWFQSDAALSLELIELAKPTRDSTVLDVGGGASRLVDGLLARELKRITVLDISRSALESAKARLCERAAEVEWVAADVTKWQPTKAFDIWHDRAAFHFLVDADDRAAYVMRLKQALKPAGYLIVGTFAIDGPDTCSGLPVNRYDVVGLAQQFGEGFALVHSRQQDHATPWHSIQRFQFCVFRRIKSRGGLWTCRPKGVKASNDSVETHRHKSRAGLRGRTSPDAAR